MALSSKNKIGLVIIGAIVLPILHILVLFIFREKMPDISKSETLILVEQKKVEAAVTSTENNSLLVKKAERKMYWYEGRKLRKTYKIALGGNPTGTKIKQGDRATPEGEYYITHKNPKSNFYLSLGISYPNQQDAARGLQSNLISQTEYEKIVAALQARQKPLQNTKLGGDIFLHGGGAENDWTWGCIALSNEDIKELFDLLPLKTPIKIEP